MKLTQKDLITLHQRLSDENLQVYTVVVMGRRDLEAGNVESCMGRLRVDMDKFRSEDELTNLIKKYFDFS